MGSTSSKSASDHGHGHGHNYKSSNGTASPDVVEKQSRTQTSLYGWGRIKHPFKPGRNKTSEQESAKTKGKAKAKPKQNGFQVNEIRMPDKSAAVPSSPNPTPTGPMVTNGATETEGVIKENGNHSTTEAHTETDAGGVRCDAATPPPSTPTATTPFRKQVLSTPSFYGHYRCPGCSKYWRSGHSKEGCAQNCSKCGTPTIPRR